MSTHVAATLLGGTRKVMTQTHVHEEPPPSCATHTTHASCLRCVHKPEPGGGEARQGWAREGQMALLNACADTHQLLGDLAAEAEGWDSALDEYQQALKLLSTCPDVKARPVACSWICCTGVLLALDVFCSQEQAPWRAWSTCSSLWPP